MARSRPSWSESRVPPRPRRDRSTSIGISNVGGRLSALTFTPALVLALAPACSDLPPARAGVCGNGAIDPGEDCDFFAGVGAPPGTTCGGPDDRTGACHWLCQAHTDCPVGWGCSPDGM